MDKDLKLDDCQLMLGDCLERMKEIPDKSIDAIICDLPFGVTACKWDSIIPFEPLWEQYNRVIKDNGAIVLFGSQPFTSALVMSNPSWYKHHWIWLKNRGTGFQVAKYRPMMKTEDIITFCKKTLKYNPQKIKLDKPLKYSSASNSNGTNPLASFRKMSYEVNEKYPTNVIEVDKVSKMIHPTQKPVALLEYLIKTYTNEGETVLDNTMGSGSTGVACVNTNRKFIGIEMDEKYYDISCKRIKEAINEKKQQLF